jgi:hypothetical protein
VVERDSSVNFNHSLVVTTNTGMGSGSHISEGKIGGISDDSHRQFWGTAHKTGAGRPSTIDANWQCT